MFIILYLLIIALYFAIRLKASSSKYMSEIIILLIAVGISFVIKLGVLLFNIPLNTLIGNNFFNFIAYCFSSLYATIGGFAFEGVMDFKEVINTSVLFHGINLNSYLYYGSSLVTGLVFISVITAKASYELYSYLLLLILKETKKNIYIFTAVNIESLLLAKSISKSDKNNLIVFAGTKINSFDRKDDLCKEIMANGYLYWSFSEISLGKEAKKKKREKNKRSLAERLHLNNQNINKFNRRFLIFSFADRDGNPLEEENSYVVFDDIFRRTQNNTKKKKDNLRIDYYILTKRDINYQAYQREYDRLKLEAIKCKKESKSLFGGEYINLIESISSDNRPRKIDKQYPGFKTQYTDDENEFFQKCQLHVINEADIVSKFISSKLLSSKYKDITIEALLTNTNNSFKVWLLGFGGIGQNALKELYVLSTTFTNHDFLYRDRSFIAEVFDPQIDRYSGLFQYEHPFFCCIDDNGSSNQNDDSTVNGEALKIKEIDRMLKHEIIIENNIVEMKKLYPKLNNLTFPIISFNKCSCTEESFMKRMDVEIGMNDCCSFLEKEIIESKGRIEKIEDDIQKDPKKDENLRKEIEKIAILEDKITRRKNINTPQVFVFSTGNDFQSICIANACIKDLSNDPNKNTLLQIFIVQIRDRRNNILLNLEEGYHKKYNLLVIIIGNLDEIYSYDVIIKDDDSKDYCYAYNFLYNISADLYKKEIKPDDQLSTYQLLARKIAGKDLKEEFTEKQIDIFTTKLRNKLKESIDYFDIIKDEKTFNHYIKDKNNSNDDIEKVKNIRNTREIDWLRCSLYDQESNHKAYSYKEVMKKHIDIVNSITEDKFLRYQYLANLEHNRWIRTMIAYGWRYNEIKDFNMCFHDCIKPLYDVPDDKVLFDIINVILVEEEMKKEKEQ